MSLQSFLTVQTIIYVLTNKKPDHMVQQQSRETFFAPKRKKKLHRNNKSWNIIISMFKPTAQWIYKVNTVSVKSTR